MLSLRKMSSEDIPTVIQLINSHDEDDAEEAQRSYEQSGIDDQYVLTQNDAVIGVTGIRQAEACDNTYWLSWTYIHDDQCGNGYGRKMLEDILAELTERGARKVFLKVSDYIDPEDGDIYAAARHLYQSKGFTTEVTLPDFYDEGETQFIMGLSLNHNSNDNLGDGSYVNNANTAEPDVLEVTKPIKFNNLFEIAETEGSFCFGWEMSGKKQFTVPDVQIGLDAAKDQGGRAAYVTFPSNFPAVPHVLTNAGFTLVGTLKDYYENGIHELHFAYYFT